MALDVGQYRDDHRYASLRSFNTATSLTQCAAIIVACLASFRQLFVKSAQSASNYPRDHSSGWFRRFLSSFQESESDVDSKQKRLGPNQRISNRSSQDSESAPVVPLNTIRVHHDVSLASISVEEGMQMSQAGVEGAFHPQSPVHHQAVSNPMWHG